MVSKAKTPAVTAETMIDNEDWLPLWRQYADRYDWCSDAEYYLRNSLGLTFKPRRQPDGSMIPRFTPTDGSPAAFSGKKFMTMVEGMSSYSGTPGVAAFQAEMQEKYPTLVPQRETTLNIKIGDHTFVVDLSRDNAWDMFPFVGEDLNDAQKTYWRRWIGSRIYDGTFGAATLSS